MTDTPEDRWKTLSAALDTFHKLASDRDRKAVWMADALERLLTDYIGIPLGRDGVPGWPPISPIRFYAYKAGMSPECDTFDLKDNVSDAIGIDAEGFCTFGIGVQLEMQPHARPRYRFNWFVRVKLDDGQWTCQVGVGDQKLFALTPPQKIEDLLPIVDAIYTGLRGWLQAASGAGSQRSIGFSTDE